LNPKRPPNPDPPPRPPLDPLAIDPGEEAGLLREPRAASIGGLTADGRLRAGKLAGLTMRRAMWVLSWPILVESFLNSLVGLTDTVLAAQISESATDAIGAAAYLMWFVGLIAMAVGVGATALVSRATGAGRMAVADAATGQSMLVAVVAGVVGGVLLAACAGPTAAVMNLSPTAAEEFTTYLRIVALGVPAISVMSAGIASARGGGDSMRPLIAMLAMNVVNLGLSWVLAGCDYVVTRWTDGVPHAHTLIHNPSPLEWGIGGVAWGTVVGEYVGAAVVVLILTRGWTAVRLRRRRLRPHMHTLRRLVRVAIPNFLETLGMWAGNFVIILLVGKIAAEQGTGVLGSHIVAIRIEAFSFLPGFAMGTAAATLAGQYLGAGSPEIARRCVWRCTLAASVFMGLAGAAFMLFPDRIVGLVTSQPVHLKLAPQLIFITGIVQIPFAVSNVLRSSLRGVGDGRAVMTLIWVSTYGVRIPLAFLLAGVELELPGGLVIPSLRSEPSLAMLWVALCAELAVRGVLFAIRFAQGRWATMRV
jgi:putative MATE family efflux protein